ncbi:MAG: response regulator transcription factor [Ruminococcaceae bacterium]|nr:response regulator transcription factor [Oscillospiraceae bacterium]
MKILVIEDEKMLADSIKSMLERKGFQVECAYDGESGRDFAMLGIYDLLILDVMLPKMDGFEVAEQLRLNRCNTPILMLTARSDLKDRIAGLNAGADYYLAKPFDSGELFASINALLRRQAGHVNEMAFGNTVLELGTSTLLCDGRSVRLSAREFDVMRLLLQSGKRNLSKAAILSRVWGLDSNAVENHAEVYVAMLRKKLSGIGSNVRIVASRGLGYHLEVKAV